MPPIKLDIKKAMNDMVSLTFISFVERSGRNICLQRPKDELLWVREKVTKYISSAKLKVPHYPKQEGLLYYSDKKEG